VKSAVRPLRLLAALLAAAATLIAEEGPPNVRSLMQRARQAYDRGDRAAFLKDYEEIARRRPGDVWILYNLACARSLNGETAEAVAALDGIAARRVAMDLAGEKDFDSIRASDGYRRVVAAMDALRKQRVDASASPAFTIPEKAVVAEGVAHDPATKAFFVASVNKGQIYRIGADGRASVFVPPSAGLRSPLGIGVDAKRRTLWVVSESIPQMNGGKEGDPPDSALFAFDLDTGKLRKRYAAPASEKPPHFDDLGVAADGRVYVNDGFNPRIYTLAPGADALELWLESDELGGTQGLAPTPDGRTLYVSDYRDLWRVDVATKKASRLLPPADLALNGVDGLVYADGRLAAIQNGIEPPRAIALDLSPDGTSIARSRILVMNDPVLDEPTLGTIVDGVLYFSANNQGHRFHDVKNPPKPDDLKDAVILRVPLH
jgi:sugar lactone lactonase YvrE